MTTGIIILGFGLFFLILGLLLNHLSKTYNSGSVSFLVQTDERTTKRDCQNPFCIKAFEKGLEYQFKEAIEKLRETIESVKSIKR
jgi:hypothetical protein